MLTGGQPLSAADVRATEGAHDAARPRLTSRPGDGVNAVAGLLEHGVELALRAIPPAHILDHNGIARLHGAQHVERDASTASEGAFLVIGGAREEYRGGCTAIQPIHVSREPYPIAHRHHDVLVNQNGCHCCPPSSALHSAWYCSSLTFSIQ